MTKPYLLFIDDNFHYQREDERTGRFEFETAEAALAEARRIVDGGLAELFKRRSGLATHSGSGRAPGRGVAEAEQAAREARYPIAP
jgi:hypothetical protein